MESRTRNRPRRCSITELRKFGVDIEAEWPTRIFRCRVDGQDRSGGKNINGYWICPNGCNYSKKNSR